MSKIKYNQFGEVVSVNGLTTGHHIGTPMQDAIGTEIENSAYGVEIQTVTPDYEANDELQPTPQGGGASSWDDLTDKPFGDELVEILPETEVEFVYDDAEAMWVGEFQAPKVVGDENNYVVVYNGVEYRGTSAHGCMGNTAISGGEDNGMPFFIMPIDESGGHLIVSLDELPKTTVSIKEFVSTPIPSKYMPEYEVLDLISLGVGELNTTNKKDTINFSDLTFLERAYKKGIIKIRVSVPIKHGTTENIGERIIWGFIIPSAFGCTIHCPITGGQLYIDVNALAETLSVTYDQFLLKS